MATFTKWMRRDSADARAARLATLTVGAAMTGLVAPTATSAQVQAIEATRSELESVSVAASSVAGGALVAEHAALIEESFGVDIGHALAVFTLSRSVFEEGGSATGNGDAGALSWTTHAISEYDWSAFPEHAGTALPLAAAGLRGAIVVGTLNGSAASVASVAMGFEWTDGQGGSVSLLVPLARLNADPTALLAQAAPVLSWPCAGAANGLLPCRNRYVADVGDAKKAFVECMKQAAAPLSWQTALCVMACAATPVFKPCVAACLAAPGVALLYFDFEACSTELHRAKCNAAQVYCNCIRHQQTYCPTVAETDMEVACPGDPSLPIPGCE